MSEKPYLQFTTKKMREYLKEIGLKDIIKRIHKDHPNYFLNNGKHLRYNYEKEEEDDYDDNAELECFRHGCCLRSL